MEKPYYKDPFVTIYHADCLRVIIPFDQFDLLFTDPPYGLDGEEPFILTKQAVRRFSWDCAAICLDWRNSIKSSRKIGELIWQYGWVSGFRSKLKEGINHTHNTIHIFGNKKRVCFPDGSIILRQPGFSSPRHCSFMKKSGHPYEKPVPLLRWILQRIKARTVVDPFCGSGSVLVAAKQERRYSVGIEIEEKWCEIAAKRCSATYSKEK